MSDKSELKAGLQQVTFGELVSAYNSLTTRAEDDEERAGIVKNFENEYPGDVLRWAYAPFLGQCSDLSA